MTNGSLMKVESIAECSRLEHSAILLTCIRQKFVLKTNLLSFWVWPFYTGFTVVVIEGIRQDAHIGNTLNTFQEHFYVEDNDKNHRYLDRRHEDKKWPQKNGPRCEKADVLTHEQQSK